jgi:phenylacetate-coenzyme A ligase PaaK-like adenylate-forming protein
VETKSYWNPILETLPPEKLRQLQLKKFKEIFKWAYMESLFEDLKAKWPINQTAFNHKQETKEVE